MAPFTTHYQPCAACLPVHMFVPFVPTNAVTSSNLIKFFDSSTMWLTAHHLQYLYFVKLQQQFLDISRTDIPQVTFPLSPTIKVLRIGHRMAKSSNSLRTAPARPRVLRSLFRAICNSSLPHLFPTRIRPMQGCRHCQFMLLLHLVHLPRRTNKVVYFLPPTSPSCLCASEQTRSCVNCEIFDTA